LTAFYKFFLPASPSNPKTLKKAGQWPVAITSVLNRKNGFAEGKIGAKVAVAQSHEEQLL